MADEGSQQLNIVVFPWLAFGHMLPFLELSKSLARRGHRVSYISTPRNIHRLPKLPVEISPLIDFISFSLPKVEGLPETAEATSDLPPEDVQHLKQAFDGLQRPFSNFIKQLPRKPDWIIQDFAQHWMPQIAATAAVPCVFFYIFQAATSVFFGKQYHRETPEQYTVPPPWVPLPSNLAFRLHEARKFVAYCSVANTSGVSDAHRMNVAIESCAAWAVRSCVEVEAEWLPLLSQIFGKTVIPVGLLPPPAETPEDEDRKCTKDEKLLLLEWLDKQRRRSVVYVAFGTEAVLSNELMHELARGLELSEVPFLWALRRPAGMAGAMDILPEGFEERTKDFGVVAKGWVPQLKILNHGSVGGLLTHMGWSSVIEALHCGHPLVMLPIFIDHGLTARSMEAKGVGVEVERDEEDGTFTKEAVARALRLVMVEEEGEPYRTRANEMRQALADRDCQEKYVDDLVRYLQNHRAEAKNACH